jgi:hypothetical protein
MCYNGSPNMPLRVSLFYLFVIIVSNCIVKEKKMNKLEEK